MNKILLFGLLFIAVLTSFGQERSGDLTIYSNAGKKFYVILNGVRQNMDAQTNVKISGLKDRRYACKIIAEDKSFNIDKNVYIKFDTLVTYHIKGKRKKFKMRYFSEMALKEVNTQNGQTSIIYQPIDQVNNSEGGKATTTTVNIGNVTITNNTVINESTHVNNTTTNQTVNTETKYEEGNLYTDDDMFVTLGGGNCFLSDEAFEKSLVQISKEGFSENKMRIAKSITKTKCMTIEQISRMAEEFSFSADRMNFVKSAYDNCLYQSDYMQLIPLFTFSKDKIELEKFILSK